jgi:hypothetical protein
LRLFAQVDKQMSDVAHLENLWKEEHARCEAEILKSLKKSKKKEILKSLLYSNLKEFKRR